MKLDKMFDLLRDKALDFATELKAHSYRSLKVKMTRRFSEKEDPIVARRELTYTQQKDDETLAEFSGRVHLKVIRGHPQANHDTIEQMAVEAFLKGCKNKEAAASAMDKNPRTIYEAQKKVKTAINNRKALYGTKASFSSRQVTFTSDDQEIDVISPDEHKLRQIRPGRGSPGPSVEKPNQGDWEKFTAAIDRMTKRFDDLETRARASSPSPSPARSPQRSDYKCFNCNQFGHFRKDCTKSPQGSPRRPLICFRCNQPGHIGSDCPNKTVSPARPISTTTSN